MMERLNVGLGVVQHRRCEQLNALGKPRKFVETCWHVPGKVHTGSCTHSRIRKNKFVKKQEAYRLHRQGKRGRALCKSTANLRNATAMHRGYIARDRGHMMQENFESIS